MRSGINEDLVETWKLELHNGDEITVDLGNNEYTGTVIIQTIEWFGRVARILTKDGKQIECLAEEIS